jgi:hypothetical protein
VAVHLPTPFGYASFASADEGQSSDGEPPWHGTARASAPYLQKIEAIAVRLGIDLDNTLIDYDHVFVKEARERGLVDRDFSGSKQAVRDAIRLLPKGELAWQRLQGYIYGVGISGARLFDGALEFLSRCRERRVPVFIVSHKTRYGNFDPDRVDLREAALGWLRSQGFFEPGACLVPIENIFFADDRAAKLARIAALDCTHYIDDLEEVFADPGFPPGVKRILFAGSASLHADIVCPRWDAIAAAIFDDRG